MALLEKAAGQGHAYAMYLLGSIYDVREEYETSVEWLTKGAEAGLPNAQYNLGVCLDAGKGVALDYPAAAGWYRRAAGAGHGRAAFNLATMYGVGRGWAWQIMSASSSFQTLVPQVKRHHLTRRAVSARP